jgi:hypothetical protein
MRPVEAAGGERGGDEEAAGHADVVQLRERVDGGGGPAEDQAGDLDPSAGDAAAVQDRAAVVVDADEDEDPADRVQGVPEFVDGGNVPADRRPVNEPGSAKNRTALMSAAAANANSNMCARMCLPGGIAASSSSSVVGSRSSGGGGGGAGGRRVMCGRVT